jgi:hypothetical protein
MKTKNQLLLLITISLLMFNTTSFAQEEEQKRPEYISVTTMHWNMDYEDWDMDTWKAVEKEYMEKVTKKNEHLMGASIFLHKLTPDNSELLYVQVYKDWDAIDKAADRNGELEDEAWPDEDERKAYFKKRGAYYAPDHSDEIYATMSGAKLIEDKSDDMILYIRKSHFAFSGNGSWKEYKELRDEHLQKVVHKNEYIKGYYPSQHAYGSDRTEFVEAFYLNSMADLDKMFDRSGELAKEAWPDAEARKDRGEKWGKYFTGIHGDYVYSVIPELSK